VSRARQKRRPGADQLAADHGTAERRQHGEMLDRATDIPGVVGKRVKHECRLDWYLDKASIIDRQHEAGIRLRRDWAIATSAPRMTVRYALRIEGRDSFTELQLAARRRIARALQSLATEARSVLIDVCCFDEWASGRLPRLRKGLTQLADHYGLPKQGAR
jgi:hypothetical protein